MGNLLIGALGVFITNSSELLGAYGRMVAAEEEKHRLARELLATLIADKPWIQAVGQHSRARQAFLEAAVGFCRSEKAKELRSSCKPNPKRTIRNSDREAHVG